MRHHVAAIALSPLALATLGLAAPPASADAAQPFSVHETLDFAHEVFTFTATGPLCPSGTFQDEVTKGVGFQSGTHGILRIDTVFTCDDGSGTFSMEKHVNFWFSQEGLPSSGPVKLTGGTGAYEGIAGNGEDVGSRPVSDDQGVGTITGVVVHP